MNENTYEATVDLSTIELIKEFTYITMYLPEAMDLADGRYKVDAKSILGILSLNIMQPLKLTIYADEDRIKEIERKLGKFIRRGNEQGLH